MRHPKPAVSVASSSARNSTASTASTATANRSHQQPQGRTLQKKRSSTTLAMAKLQANAAAPAAGARRIRRKPVGSVRSVHPDIEFDSQPTSADEQNGRLEEGQAQSEYFESVNGQSAGTATPGIASSNVSDDDEDDDGDEQWELAPDQTIPRSPSPTLHRQQAPNRGMPSAFPQPQQHQQQLQHHHQQSPYMLHHPQFHAHLHGGGGASPAASNRTSVASSQYGGAPGTPSMSVVTTDVSSLNSSVLANAAALDRVGDHRRPSSGISDRPAHFRHSNLTDYSSIRSAQVSEMGGPSSSGAAGGRASNAGKAASEPVMQVSPTSTHVKFDSTRGRLSGCLVFTVRVAGVPAVADKPKPQALLGSPRDPTIIVEGKAEPTTNTWAWMGGSSTGSVRSNNAGGSVRRRAQAAHKQVGSIRGAGHGAPNLNAVPVRSSLRGANPDYFMGSVRSMRSVTFALEAEAEREMLEQQRIQQQQPAKKHTVQINFEFGRNKLTENRRSLIVSLKFTLRVASMQVPYTAQAPVQWNRASRISFKRVPVMDLNCVSLFRETPQKSIGHNLSFRYPSVRALYSPAASSTDNLHARGGAPVASRNASPSAGKRSVGRRQRHKQAVKSPHGSLRGSLRHMPPSLAMRTGAAGSLRKKTSHTNLLAAMAAGTPAAAHPHAAPQVAPRNQSPQPHLYHRRRRSRIPESWMFGQSAVGESPGPSDIEFYQGGNSVRSGMSNVLARSLPPPPPSQATTGQRVARRAPDSVRSVGPEIKFDSEEVAEEHEYQDYNPGPRVSRQQQQQQTGRGGNGPSGPQYHQQQQYMMSAMGPQYSAPNVGAGGVQGGNQFDYAQHQQQPGIMFQQHHMQHQQQQSHVPMLQGAAADPDNPMSSMGLARNVYTQVRAWNDAGHSSMDQQQSEQPQHQQQPDGAHQFPIDYSVESSGASYAHHSSMFDGVVHHHHHHGGAFVVHDGQGHAHVMADYGSVASSTGDKGSIVSAQ
ncbi:hypothetical protein BCR44DRAFT_1100987 [Catenaria anguillulae PL171]|uniref:Uncharacterized protein n=1 Tax=Catenaria anguillulae PL171 TaxID=765915 RepID=A0A1Y2I258_9FUNG|nr:hypothetical protein BCR44DRAFT_1100987 [Catenaria anguillulae PL171]